jgi:hypothetical protein
MKKFRRVLAAVTLLFVVAGAAFAAPRRSASSHRTTRASSKVVKNAITLDIVPLVKGFAVWDKTQKTYPWGFALSYERRLVKMFSLLGRFGLYSGKALDCNFLFWELDAHTRFYPSGMALERLFIDASLGVNNMRCKDMPYTEFFGVKFSLGLGWKFILKRHFVIEPLLAYVIAKSAAAMQFTPVGWQVGFNIGGAF